MSAAELTAERLAEGGDTRCSAGELQEGRRREGLTADHAADRVRVRAACGQAASGNGGDARRDTAWDTGGTGNCDQNRVLRTTVPL